MFNKQCIFTVTAGRTGTNLLQQLLGLFPDTLSVHEPEPDFVHVMRRAQQNPEIGLAFCAGHKLPFIASVSQSRYVETSHLFCKGFVEAFIKLGVVPDIVVLRRAPRDIAKSLLKLNTVPARSGHGLMYLLGPDDPGVLPLPQWQLLNDYQLCYWYCLEIERRQLKYAAVIANLGGRVAETSLHQLLEFEHFCALATALGFDADVANGELLRQHQQITANKVNEKFAAAISTADAELDRLEQEVAERVSYYEPLLVTQVSRRYSAAEH